MLSQIDKIKFDNRKALLLDLDAYKRKASTRRAGTPVPCLSSSAIRLPVHLLYPSSARLGPACSELTRSLRPGTRRNPVLRLPRRLASPILCPGSAPSAQLGRWPTSRRRSKRTLGRHAPLPHCPMPRPASPIAPCDRSCVARGSPVSRRHPQPRRFTTGGPGDRSRQGEQAEARRAEVHRVQRRAHGAPRRLVAA